MTEPRIQLACLDIAGTTVSDAGTVGRAFDAALDAMAVPEADRQRMADYVRDTMGMSKIEVFRSLFSDETRAQAANSAFEGAYENSIDGVEPIPGAAETIGALRQRGLRVALTTGFSARTRNLLLDALGWQEIADVVLSPSDAGRGRPYPDMILTAVIRTGVDAVQAVAVVGDTAADVTSGLRSGATVVAGVLTGADDKERLSAAGATAVVASIVTVPALFD
jgi:phosphoglycolate phosphatase